MFRRFFLSARGDRAVRQYQEGVAGLLRGDFTVLDQSARDLRRSIDEQVARADSLSPAMARLLRAKLVLLAELDDQENGPKSNWSLAFPLSALRDRLSARFNPQSRAGLARLIEQTSPGVGYLSSGWLAPVGIGVTLTIAMVALFTNPAELAKAGTSPAAVTQPAPKDVPGSQPPPAVDSGRNAANGDAAKAKGVSTAVTLPNAAGHSGGAKLDPPLKLEPRRIVIRRQYEIRVGDHFFTSSDHTTSISCGVLKGEQFCEIHDALPKPEAWSDGTMCWEIIDDDRGAASYCARSN